MKFMHYVNGKLTDKCTDISLSDEKNSKKYEFFLDNITNYIYITDRLVFKRESDDYIFELNLGDISSCKIYLKKENHELILDIISSKYEINDRYIDFKYVLETDDNEHHIILEIGDK